VRQVERIRNFFHTSAPSFRILNVISIPFFLLTRPFQCTPVVSCTLPWSGQSLQALVGSQLHPSSPFVCSSVTYLFLQSTTLPQMTMRPFETPYLLLLCLIPSKLSFWPDLGVTISVVHFSGVLPFLPQQLIISNVGL